MRGGARKIVALPTVWDVSWQVGGGSLIPATGRDVLPIQTIKTIHGETGIYRVAVGFAPDLPEWANWVSQQGYTTLALYVISPIYPARLVIRYPTTALTPGMTCDQLDSAWSGGTQTPTDATIQIDEARWYYIHPLARPDYVRRGLMLGVSAATGGNYTHSAALGGMAAGLGAVLILHGQYSMHNTIPGIAVYRPDLTALADRLTDSTPTTVRVEQALIRHSAADARVPDTDVSDRLRAGGEIVLQADTSPIEPWSLNLASLGVLSVAQPDDCANILDTPQYRGIAGVPAELELDAIVPTGAPVPIATVNAVIARAEQAAGALDLELTSAVAADMDSPPRRYWPTPLVPGEVDGGLRYDNGQSAVLVLYDLLANVCPSTRWDQILYADWYELATRFGGTWSRVTLTADDLAGETSIQGVFEAMLRTLCLCTGSDLSGRVQVWHPAVYRPSLRVHHLDPLEDYASDIRLTSLSAEQYDVVRIPWRLGDTEGSDDYAVMHLSHRGRVYTHDWPLEYLRNDSQEWPGVFTAIRTACARQLMQRLCEPAVRLSCRVGLMGLTWALGDQLIVSSPRHGLKNTPYMITRLNASPMESTVEVEAVHYTGWPGGHSTFRAPGPLGLWRWRRHHAWVPQAPGPGTPGNPTLDNLTWATNRTMNMGLYGPGTSWTAMPYGTWEGAGMYIEETGAVNGKGYQTTPVTYMGVQLPTQTGDTYPTQADVQIALMSSAVQLVGDKQYDWLWRWCTHGFGAGLALLIHNPWAPNPCPAHCAEIVLAHCANCNPGIGQWGGANILASVTLSGGLVMPASAGAGTYGNVKALSVAWDPSGEARLYDGQRLIGSLTTSGLSPLQCDGFSVRTPRHDSGMYVLNFFTRLTHHDSPPAAGLMLPDDGRDPYYP